jgi:hypothetical protein
MMNNMLAIYEVKRKRPKEYYCNYGDIEMIWYNSGALVNAIIIQACDDYRLYKRQLRRAFVKKQRANGDELEKIDGDIRQLRCDIRKIERFLEESDLVALASNDLGADILRRLKREV